MQVCTTLPAPLIEIRKHSKNSLGTKGEVHHKNIRYCQQVSSRMGKQSLLLLQHASVLYLNSQSLTSSYHIDNILYRIWLATSFSDRTLDN